MVDPMVRVHSHRPPGEDLKPRKGECIRKFARPVGDKARGHEARNESEHSLEGLLVMPAGIGGKGYRHSAGGAEQCRGKEADPDRASRGLVPINLGEDVAEYVGNREK